MNLVKIIDTDGNIIEVCGIYYISNNNYYFMYTKKEQDNDNHIIFYVVKILQEVANGTNGPIATGNLLGFKISDENEYNMVKRDITNIVNDRENNTESVKYLDLSLLQSLKIRDNRTFKLGMDIYNKIFSSSNSDENNNSDINKDIKSNSNINIEQLIRENEQLKQEIEEYRREFSLISEIIN